MSIYDYSEAEEIVDALLMKRPELLLITPDATIEQMIADLVGGPAELGYQQFANICGALRDQIKPQIQAAEPPAPRPKEWGMF